jgi:peptidoglycan/LPS O-acetylase OafA/YrhL
MPIAFRALVASALLVAPLGAQDRRPSPPPDTTLRVVAGDRARLRVGLPVRTVTGLVVAVGDSGVVLAGDAAHATATTYRPTQLYGFEVARGRRSRLVRSLPMALGGMLLGLVIGTVVDRDVVSGPSPEKALPGLALTGLLVGGGASLLVRPPVRWVDAMGTIPHGLLRESVPPPR